MLYNINYKYNYGRKYNGWIDTGFESKLFAELGVSTKGPFWVRSPVFPNWYMCVRPLVTALDSTRLKHDILKLLITSKPFRDSAYSLICMLENSVKDNYGFYYLRNRTKPWRDTRCEEYATLKETLNPIIKQLYREFKNVQK